MSTQPPPDPYGQRETADLIRSAALSSARLWEEVFDRLNKLESAQDELRQLLGRLDAALPAGAPPMAALGESSDPAPSGVWGASSPPATDSSASWSSPGFGPDLSGPEAVESWTSFRAPADFGVYVQPSPGSTLDVTVAAAAGAVPATGGIVDPDVELGDWAGAPVPPVAPSAPSATFSFQAPPEPPPAVSDVLQWGADTGFGETVVVPDAVDSPDAVVGASTQETDESAAMSPDSGPFDLLAGAQGGTAGPERTEGAEVAVADAGEEAPLSRHAMFDHTALGGLDDGTAPPVPPGVPDITDLAWSPPANARGFHDATDLLGWGAPEPATGVYDLHDTGAPTGLEWGPLGDAPDTSPLGDDLEHPALDFDLTGDESSFGIPLDTEVVFAPLDVDAPPPPPPGFALTDADGLVPPPPPGFALTDAGEVVPPPPPGFALTDAGEVVPPPPPGFALTGAGEVPPPPPGFALTGEGELPPPPPGFALTGEGELPPPPPGFALTATIDLVPPPVSSGFEPTAAGELAPPVDFAFGEFQEVLTASDAVVGDGEESNGHEALSEPTVEAPPPPPGFEPSAGASVPDAAPPPPAGFSPQDFSGASALGGEVPVTRRPKPKEPEVPPPPITPDFFARAGRRRR